MMHRRFHTLLLILLTLAGCYTAPPTIVLPDPRPLGRDLPARPAAATPEQEPPAPVDPRGVLTLRDALAAAVLGSPDLAAASQEVRVAEALELQASLAPNPEVAIELEEFGGTGDAKGFDASELSLGLGQEILLGGKIGKRTAVAELEGRLAGWDYEAARLDVLTECTRAFVAALAAEEQVKVLTESVRLSEAAARSVAEQVEAGKVPRLSESRAAVSHALQQLALQRAVRRLAADRHALAASWGGTAVSFALARPAREH